MSTYQLEKKIILKGKIVLLTGLHIGGTNTAMSIGGMDKSVIRNPITNKPYIPGSSLKGKMRSLTELSHGTIGNKPMGKNIKHGPTEDPLTIAAQLFGTAIDDDKNRPSRVLVRDANLKSDDELFANTELPYTETKTEVVIDRITSAAMPRQVERVPAGAEFALEIVLNIFKEDLERESTLFSKLLGALKLVQDDYLGGNGSRGHGQISFEIASVMVRSKGYYTEDEAEAAYLEHAAIPESLRTTETVGVS